MATVGQKVRLGSYVDGGAVIAVKPGQIRVQGFALVHDSLGFDNVLISWQQYQLYQTRKIEFTYLVNTFKCQDLKESGRTSRTIQLVMVKSNLDSQKGLGLGFL